MLARYSLLAVAGLVPAVLGADSASTLSTFISKADTSSDFVAVTTLGGTELPTSAPAASASTLSSFISKADSSSGFVAVTTLGVSALPSSTVSPSFAPNGTVSGTTSTTPFTELPGVVITGGTTRTVFGTNTTPTSSKTGATSTKPTSSVVTGAAAGMAPGGMGGLLGAAAALGAGIAML